MAYTEDAVKAKLSALNETQESIVSNSQWIMFHRRHADKTAAIWLQRLRDSGAPKRLNLVYLANEVIQQSKARKRDDFVNAFSPIIADATAIAYKGATNEVQNKLRRVVEVWKQRSIFEPSIQEAVEGRIAELDKTRSSGKKNLLGGNIFGSSAPSASVPPELQPLQTALADITKASVNLTTLFSTADSEYAKSMSGDNDTPSPPVHAARLSALVKSLAAAESAANASATARQALITGLEALLASAKAELETDKAAETKFAERKVETEAKKRDVEDAIMRGLGTDGDDEQYDLSTPAETNGRASAPPVHDDDDDSDQRRPEVEALTPPPIESFTPPDDPPVISGYNNSNFVTNGPSTSEFMHPPVTQEPDFYAGYAPEEPSLMSPVNGHASKKRKMTDDGTFGGFVPGGDAMADLDADVAELLRSEGGGRV